ncbi:hypothetical protein J1605_022176 [Eschrichtius robustus]|uniref:Uncharacterized protein n=1 Tax=Eschrichtius robustus TaxID=9764 RepID=A0AB34HBU7_ESCRO|nr:hypothetical protein J1605_022176 [Eschrichtius robustus]
MENMERTWSGDRLGGKTKEGFSKVKFFWPQQAVCRERGERPPLLEGERGWALFGPGSHFFPVAGAEPQTYTVPWLTVQIHPGPD